MNSMEAIKQRLAADGSAKVTGITADNIGGFRIVVRLLERALNKDLSVTFMAWGHADAEGKPAQGTSAIVEVVD